MSKVLAQADMLVDHDRAKRSPHRELSYYGGIRRGLDKVREGLQEAEDVAQELLAGDPDNVRLQRYMAKLEQVQEMVHRQLWLKSNRIKVSTGSGE